MKEGVERYKNASNVMPHVVMADLDSHACAPKLMSDWGIASELPRLIFRVAVREVESWVLGDREGVAEWLQVARAKVPQDPERLADPKSALLALGRKSLSRRLRSELCPAPGSSASQGPLYNQRLCGFIAQEWNLARARLVAPSLDKACVRIAGCVPSD